MRGEHRLEGLREFALAALDRLDADRQLRAGGKGSQRLDALRRVRCGMASFLAPSRPLFKASRKAARVRWALSTNCKVWPRSGEVTSENTDGRADALDEEESGRAADADQQRQSEKGEDQFRADSACRENPKNGIGA